MDSASPGGDMSPLREILPHLDYYVPSLAEATTQTGETDPRRIVQCYRDAGSRGVLGVKLGAAGAVLSSLEHPWIEVQPVSPPGPVVDTTGAGDAFYAGLLRGQLLGWSLARSGQLAAAMGACCVTGLGASAAIPRWKDVVKLIDS